METIKLKDVQCRHNLAIRTGYHGSTVHIIVFYDPRDHETYIWKCTSGGLEWEEGETYSITAQYNGDCQISRVRQIQSLPDYVESEQPHPAKINALDILLPDMQLTNDEKYDMIRTNN